jgi:hypothetical protein
MKDLDKAIAEQVEDAEAHPLPQPGEIGGGHGRDYNVMPGGQGNSADYLARRLARVALPIHPTRRTATPHAKT